MSELWLFTISFKTVPINAEMLSKPHMKYPPYTIMCNNSMKRGVYEIYIYLIYHMNRTFYISLSFELFTVKLYIPEHICVKKNVILNITEFTKGTSVSVTGLTGLNQLLSCQEYIFFPVFLSLDF